MAQTQVFKMDGVYFQEMGVGETTPNMLEILFKRTACSSASLSLLTRLPVYTHAVDLEYDVYQTDNLFS
jgi:hypothetical protein